MKRTLSVEPDGIVVKYNLPRHWGGKPMTEHLRSPKSAEALRNRVRRVLCSRYGSVASAERALDLPRKTLAARLSGRLVFRAEELQALVEQTAQDRNDADALMSDIMGIRPRALQHSEPAAALSRFFRVEDETCPLLRKVCATSGVTGGDELAESEFSRLESLRISDPQAVADECAGLIERRWPPQSTARLLATWAACERRMENPSRAAAILHAALQLECPLDTRSSIEVLQKVAYLLLAISPHDAYVAVDQAHRLAVRARNEEKVGETFVDLGLAHAACGNDGLAQESYCAALRYLCPHQVRNRKTAHISLAYFYCTLDRNIAEARRHAEIARDLESEEGPSFGTACLLWTMAIIEYHARNLDAAAKLIQAAVSLLGTAAPRDQLFAHLQLHQIQAELNPNRPHSELLNALPALQGIAEQAGSAAVGLLLAYTAATLAGNTKEAKAAVRCLGADSGLRSFHAA